MKRITDIVFLLILIFHILYTAHATYSLYADYDGWTNYKWHPILCLALTWAWFGAYKKKYQFAFVYIGLVMLEFMSKAVFGKYAWSHVTGSVMFPMDMIFMAVMLALFKLHFGDLRRPDREENINS